MLDPSSPMNRLRRISLALAEGEPVPVADAAWFVAATTRYEAGAGTVELDVALGLGRPGKRGWWTVERLEARDAALVEFWRTKLPGMSDNQAAEEIARLARRGAAALQPILCFGAIPDARQLLTILRKCPPPVHFHGETSAPRP